MSDYHNSSGINKLATIPKLVSYNRNMRSVRRKRGVGVQMGRLVAKLHAFYSGDGLVKVVVGSGGVFAGNFDVYCLKRQEIFIE